MKNWKITLISLAVLLLSSLCGLAQGGNVFSFVQFKAKPGMEMQAEAAVKSHMAWHREQGDTWSWAVYQMMTGPDTGSYVALSGPHSWADFDAREEFEKKDQANAAGNIAKSVEIVSTWYETSRDEVSNWPDTVQPFLVQVTTFYLKPGSGAAFGRAVEKLHKILRAADSPAYYSWSEMAFGDADAWTVAVPTKDWAGLQAIDRELEKHVTAALGPEKTAAAFGDLFSHVVRTQSNLARFRGDLSYFPAP